MKFIVVCFLFLLTGVSLSFAQTSPPPIKLISHINYVGNGTTAVSVFIRTVVPPNDGNEYYFDNNGSPVFKLTDKVSFFPVRARPNYIEVHVYIQNAERAKKLNSSIDSYLKKNIELNRELAGEKDEGKKDQIRALVVRNENLISAMRDQLVAGRSFIGTVPHYFQKLDCRQDYSLCEEYPFPAPAVALTQSHSDGIYETGEAAVFNLKYDNVLSIDGEEIEVDIDSWRVSEFETQMDFDKTPVSAHEISLSTPIFDASHLGLWKFYAQFKYRSKGQREDLTSASVVAMAKYHHYVDLARNAGSEGEKGVYNAYAKMYQTAVNDIAQSKDKYQNYGSRYMADFIVRNPGGAFGLVVSSNQSEVVEGESYTFSVRLSEPPVGIVEVSFSGEKFGDMTGYSIVFDEYNWNSTQDVTVIVPANGSQGDTGDYPINLLATGGGYSGVTAIKNVHVVDATEPFKFTNFGQTTAVPNVTLVWDTNRPATSQIKIENYYTGEVIYTPADTALKTQHSVQITGLIPGMAYMFYAVSVDENGTQHVSGGISSY